MEIKATKNGDALEVTLFGRLDTNTSPDLEGYLRENLEGVASLAIDLADTQYVRAPVCACSCSRTRSWRRWGAGSRCAIPTSTSPMCSTPRASRKS